MILHLTQTHCVMIAFVLFFVICLLLNVWTKQKTKEEILFNTNTHLRSIVKDMTNSAMVKLDLVRVDTTGKLTTLYTGDDYDMALCHYHKSRQYHDERGVNDNATYQVQVRAMDHCPVTDGASCNIAKPKHVAIFLLPEAINACRSGLRFDWVS